MIANCRPIVIWNADMVYNMAICEFELRFFFFSSGKNFNARIIGKNCEKACFGFSAMVLLEVDIIQLPVEGFQKQLYFGNGNGIDLHFLLKKISQIYSRNFYFSLKNCGGFSVWYCIHVSPNYRFWSFYRILTTHILMLTVTISFSLVLVNKYSCDNSSHNLMGNSFVISLVTFLALYIIFGAWFVI